MPTAEEDTRRTRIRNRTVIVCAGLVFGLLSAILVFEWSPEAAVPIDAQPKQRTEAPSGTPSEPRGPSSTSPPTPATDMPTRSSPPSAAEHASPGVAATSPQQEEIVLSIEEIYETQESTRREPAAERAAQRMRSLFEQAHVAEAVRDVTCRQTICRLELLWSEAITVPYNEALVKIVHEFTNEMSILPEMDGAPTTPVTVYVRYRPAA